MPTSYRQMSFILIISLLTLSACITERSNNEFEGANIQVGDKLPDFSIPLNDGTTVSTRSLVGKISLIMLMSVTCPDCQIQLPRVDSLYNDYTTDENVVIFAISRAQGEAKVSKYWVEKSLNIPYSAQDNAYIYSLFAKNTVPRIYISDRNGIVRKMYTDNPLASYADLQKDIASLMESHSIP